MTSPDGLIHHRLPPETRISARDTGQRIGTEDVEQISPEYIAAGIASLREALGLIARQAENRSHPVDEYNTVPITGAATESTLTISPTYEYMPEKIEAILVSGPPAAAVTLVLGDRQWPVVIPAAGILPIGPLSLILHRNDARQLVASTPGTYFMELMGIADARFEI